MSAHRRMIRISLCFLIAILFLLPSLYDLAYAGEHLTPVSLQDMLADVEDGDPSDGLDDFHLSDDPIVSLRFCAFFQAASRWFLLEEILQPHSLPLLAFTVRPPPIL